VAPCGYQPSEIQTAYNLTPLYQAGLDGTGTTIAIVDAFGSTTIARMRGSSRPPWACRRLT